MIFRPCGSCGEGFRASDGLLGGAAHGTEGKAAEKPVNREGTGGGLFGALDQSGLGVSKEVVIDLTDRTEALSLASDRFVESIEAAELLYVLNRGDLGGGGGSASPPLSRAPFDF